MSRTTNGWSTIIGYAIIVLVMVAGFAYVDGQREASTQDGRFILCSGIVANTGNVARDDPQVIALCREVGVNRADYPATAVP